MKRRGEKKKKKKKNEEKISRKNKTGKMQNDHEKQKSKIINKS